MVALARRTLQFLVSTMMLFSVGMHASAAETGNTPDNSIEGVVEIIDELALSLIDREASLHIHGRGYRWTEGPLWIEEGAFLLFSDIPNNVIHSYNADSGTQVYLEDSGATGLFDTDDNSGSNGLLLDPQGRLVLFQQGDRRIALMNARLSEPASEFTTLAGSYLGKRLNSPNDGVFHSDGSLYFTDPPYGLEKGMKDSRKELSFQGIYRLDSNGELELLDDTVSFPNGIALTGDEKRLIVAVSDPDTPVWLVYDINPDGSLGNKQIFYDASALIDVEGEQGLPDGMALHSSGNIFATGPGGVWIFAPDGRVLAKIRTGKLTANCSLSADERVLFITAHDTLMSISLR